jgi:hypothetical protein
MKAIKGQQYFEGVGHRFRTFYHWRHQTGAMPALNLSKS